MISSDSLKSLPAFGLKNCSFCPKIAYWATQSQEGELRATCGGGCRGRGGSVFSKLRIDKPAADLKRKQDWRVVRKAALKAAKQRPAGTCGVLNVFGNKKIDGTTKMVLGRFVSVRNPVVVDHLGAIPVFPNCKHGSFGRHYRTTQCGGHGMCSLSPRLADDGVQLCVRRGVHCEIFATVEAVMQAPKVYPDMLEKGVLTSAAEDMKTTFRAANPAGRHLGGAARPNECLYSMLCGQTFSYIEARYFYCRAYELSKESDVNFGHMRRMLQQGLDINIVGYDGPYEGATVESLSHRYEDPSRPFGHELVIYAMMTLGPEDRPWTLYARAHADMYEGFTVVVQ